MTTYLDRLAEAMTVLGRDERTIFMGQAVAYPGTGMTRTFVGVPREKLLELPVFEDTQLGMAIGLSLAGYVPICVYPRINFLLLAMSQLVLHLDALPRYSDYRPRVIIRTAVAHPEPLNPGAQHLGDYAPALRTMLRNVEVRPLMWGSSEIVPAYGAALNADHSTILVEYHELYDKGE